MKYLIRVSLAIALLATSNIASADSYVVDCAMADGKSHAIEIDEQQKSLRYLSGTGWEFYRMDWGGYWQPFHPGLEKYTPFRHDFRGGLTYTIFIENTLLSDLGDGKSVACVNDGEYYERP